MLKPFGGTPDDKLNQISEIVELGRGQMED
jgi:hypothetical protein